MIDILKCTEFLAIYLIKYLFFFEDSPQYNEHIKFAKDTCDMVQLDFTGDYWCGRMLLGL